MKRYEATPFYEVESGDVRVQFDFFGVYETSKDEEITVLDALCPVWVKCAEQPEPELQTEEAVKVDEADTPAKTTTRKSSAK